MSRTIEARLAKLEQTIAPKRLSHEDYLSTLDALPPLTEAEARALDAEIEAEFGSLAAAAVAARAKARRTRNPLDDFLAADLECRAASLVSSVYQ